jgi:hypothetical protein
VPTATHSFSLDVEGTTVLTLRPRRHAVALVIALIGVCALASPAGAATKPYSVVISAPSTLVPPGVSVPYQAKITNRAPNQTLGSAKLTVPAGLSSVTVSVPAPAKAVPTTVPNEFLLLNLGVAFGKSFTATVNATAPSANPCASVSFTWQVAAKQSNDFNGAGNDFGPLASDSILTTSTSCTGTTTTPCEAPCLGTRTDADASISVSIPGSIGLVTITRGTGLDCAGYDEILAQDFTVDFQPNPGTVGGTKIVTIDITKAAMQASSNNGLSQVNVCFEAPFTFDAKLGLEGPAQGPFRGLLLNCGTPVPGASPPRAAGPPCVSDRVSVGGGARIVVRAPGGDQDPRYGP